MKRKGGWNFIIVSLTLIVDLGIHVKILITENEVGSWMYLGDIMLSEINQTEKDKYHMISLICGI